MIFRYMKKTLGQKAAVIIPAILFALNSDSIWPGALAHSLWNFLIKCSSEITTSHRFFFQNPTFAYIIEESEKKNRTTVRYLS